MKWFTWLLRKPALPVFSEDHRLGWKGLCVCCDCSVSRVQKTGLFCWDAEAPPREVARYFGAPNA